jgi:hypothetical protein
MANLKTVLQASLLLCGSLLPLLAQTNVLMQHNDIGRTGQNLTETILTPATIEGGNFGKLYSIPIDGVSFSQPLYVSSLLIGGVSHSVLSAATQNDSVYAFDANDGGAQLWKASLFDAAHGAAPGATTEHRRGRHQRRLPAVCSYRQWELRFD